MSAWLKTNGPTTERNLMKWDAMPATPFPITSITLAKDRLILYGRSSAAAPSRPVKSLDAERGGHGGPPVQEYQEPQVDL